MLKTVGHFSIIMKILTINLLITVASCRALRVFFLLGSGMVNTVVKRIEEMNNKVHNLAFDVAFLPLKCKINSMSFLQVRWWLTDCF